MPQLQRDYAQGRDSAKEIRDAFLDALHGALLQDRDNEALPLNLDFVYGNMEENGGKCFLPLDGQQRLTTLFLLHWYLAWRDGHLARFQEIAWDGRRSRFSYAVRPSSTEFFDELVQYIPDHSPDEVSSVRRLIENQPWFYLHWQLDPTIQSALTMLDAIHGRFSNCNGLFSRLSDKERPAITFGLMPLEHFGLSDDLYIKMNARGKPLTPFETFKARFEQDLKEIYPDEYCEIDGTSVPVHDFFSRRMDTRWTDFFWHHRTPWSDTFDTAAMNLFWIIAWASCDPDNQEAAGPSIARYRQSVGGYSEFHDQGLLTRAFADNLICLLEAWSSDGGPLHLHFPDTRYFDEAALFTKITTHPTSLRYDELVLFASYLSYLRFNEGTIRATELQEWMRVVFNLVQNSDIERPDDLDRSLSGIQKLLPHSREILAYLATAETEPLGFSREQVQEELLKARLMQAHTGWTDRIHAAEAHGYFCGQIGFLLDFSGVSELANELPVKKWTSAKHVSLQNWFDEYLAKAKLMFNERGIADLPGELHQWQRSLLAVGNYLVPLGRNHSFLTNSRSNPDSWKRFLRGGTVATSGRDHLKVLWDRLDLSRNIGPQLASILNPSTLEPWRAAIVVHPQVIEYCSLSKIRMECGRIYLLKRTQMNGAHAELFTYVLHLKLDTERQLKRLVPLVLLSYQYSNMTDVEPHIILSMPNPRFVVTSAAAEFHIVVSRNGLSALPGSEKLLLTNLKFTSDGESLTRVVPYQEAEPFLFELAARLARVKTK